MSPTVAEAGGAPGSGGAPEARRLALAWLEPRLEGVPEELAGAVRDLVRSAEPGGGTPVPRMLARAAVEELDRVASGSSGERDAAVRLLAADAALTYAFEAASDLDADVPSLAREVGLHGWIGERLAELREGATRGDGVPAEVRGEPGADEPRAGPPTPGTREDAP